MDATFRLVDCGEGAETPGTAPGGRNLRQQEEQVQVEGEEEQGGQEQQRQQLKQRQQLFAMESMSQPGHFLTADPATGQLHLLQGLSLAEWGGGSAGSSAGSRAGGRAGAAGCAAAASPHQTFTLSWQALPEGSTAAAAAGRASSGAAPGATPHGPAAAFALQSAGGTAVQLPPPAPGTPTATGSSGGSSSSTNSRSSESRDGKVPPPGSFVMLPPAAPAYPKGSRLLTGHNRQYLLVPLGQVRWVAGRGGWGGVEKGGLGGMPRRT